MAKLAVTVNAAMEKALIDEAAKRGAPVASVVREAVKEFFEKRGVKLDAGVDWGGARRGTSAEE